MKVYLTVHPQADTHEDVFREIATPLVNHEFGWNDVYTVDTPNESNSVVMLTPGKVLGRMFPQFAKRRLSVCDMNTREIWINEDRWLRTLPDESQLPLPAYRSYVLTHELGHALGLGHADPPKKGLAPIMMQQTVGIGTLTPNPFPTEEERAWVSGTIS